MMMGRTPLNHLDDVTPDARAEQVGRFSAQAIAISELLGEAGIGPCTITEGVVQLIARAEAAEAELVRLRSELAQWKTCSLCGEQMEAPGACASSERERQEGYELMNAQLLDRAEAADQANVRLRSEIEQVQANVLNAFTCDCADTGKRDCPRCKWLWEFDRLAALARGGE